MAVDSQGRPCSACQAAKEARDAREAELNARSAELKLADGSVPIVYLTRRMAVAICGNHQYYFQADKIAIDVSEYCAKRYVSTNPPRARWPTPEELGTADTPGTMVRYEAETNKREAVMAQVEQSEGFHVPTLEPSPQAKDIAPTSRTARTAAKTAPKGKTKTAPKGSKVKSGSPEAHENTLEIPAAPVVVAPPEDFVTGNEI